MDLDVNQQKKFSDFLVAKASLMKCPACGGQNFSPQKNLYTPLTMDGPSSVSLNPEQMTYMPMLAAACSNCGNILFFGNAIVGV